MSNLCPSCKEKESVLCCECGKEICLCDECRKVFEAGVPGFELSHVGKLHPFDSFSTTPGAGCPRGRVLARQPGSICRKCYGKKGMYVNTAPTELRQRNLARLKQADKTGDWESWIEEMTLVVANTRFDYFRWHDTGDIISRGHFEAIREVCKNNPLIKFWLPTRERDYIGLALPENLCMRYSADMFDQVDSFTKGLITKGFPVAVVQDTVDMSKMGWLCPCNEFQNYGVCVDPCKFRCWDKSEKVVVYTKH